MFASKFVAAWRMAIVAVFVWFLWGTSVLAQSQPTKPTVSWLASSVPDSSRIELSKIFETNSTAQMRLITQGSCAVKGNFLTTTKVGNCKIELQLNSTPKFTATTSVVIIQVKKKTELTVLVTASLTNSFEKIGEVFMSRYLNVSVRFNFAGSATLVTQIQQGAPVDIVAMADTINMNKVLSSGDVDKESISILARNKLAILVQRGNPQNIKTLGDLTRSGLKVVLCDLAQPCGK
ncbi:MAG: molybdate ABC transporter substrate-binding protein, partial [Ilumatobacteraceae bacterium]